LGPEITSVTLTQEFALTFHGDSCDLQPIVEAIEQLWHKATVQLQQRASA
jgi:hypothetical protein